MSTKAKVAAAAMLVTSVCLTSALGTERIIDDGDGGCSAEPVIGYWLPYTTGGGYGGDFLHDNRRNKGVSNAYWIYLVTPGVACDVYVTWVKVPSGFDAPSANNAPYTVKGIQGGDQTFAIDQRVEPVADLTRGGRPFQKLGTFTPTGFKLTVHLHTDGTGVTYVVADASLVVSDGLPTSTESVIDSAGGAPGWVSSGAWSVAASGQTYAYNGNVHYTDGTTAGRECTWNFTGLTPGAVYDVAAAWHIHSNRATDTPYQIQGVEGGDVTLRVNQELIALNHHRVGGAPFQSLGVYTNTGPTLTVRMYSGDANQIVVADAVLIQFIASAAVPPFSGTILTIQ